jgi:hypothetical protein
MICHVAYLNREKYGSLAVVWGAKSPVGIFRASSLPFGIYTQESLKGRPEDFHTFINFHTTMVSSGFS